VTNSSQNPPSSSNGPFGGEIGKKLLAATPWKELGSLIDKFLHLDDLEQLCEIARRQAAGDSFFTKLLASLNLTCDCLPGDLQRVPEQGPVIVVANHPFGLAEGPALGSLLVGIRSDIRFLANSLLVAVPELREYVIPVDPFGGDAATRSNLKPLRQAIEWVRGGGLLVVFPAGEVASLQLPKPGIQDPAWNESVARLVRITRANVVPVFFHGTNSAAFHIAGLAHPRLRTVLLSRELLNKRGSSIRVSIGGPISAQSLSRLENCSDAIHYLRERTHLLRARKETHATSKLSLRKIIAPMDAALMRDEIERLAPQQKLVTSGEYLVCMATAEQIPKTLLEIGRLREICFREAGEGTGRDADLDVFDQRYHHLLVWNAERSEVVGAYRLAGTDVMRSRFGSKGLYTATLFRFKANFLASIEPALELGRSFVRTEYQKTYVPLLLLWKGIGRFVSDNPRYRTLFGPASISNHYSPASRALMVAYLKKHCYNDRLAQAVGPKAKFRAPLSIGATIDKFAPLLQDLEELSKVVSDLEPDKKGVPVLLRQYVNIGGQILEFSVDGRFSRALDGLIVVDLTKADRRLLNRYMGEAGANNFLRYHRSDDTSAA